MFDFKYKYQWRMSGEILEKYRTAFWILGWQRIEQFDQRIWAAEKDLAETMQKAIGQVRKIEQLYSDKLDVKELFPSNVLQYDVDVVLKKKDSRKFNRKDAIPCDKTTWNPLFKLVLNRFGPSTPTRSRVKMDHEDSDLTVRTVTRQDIKIVEPAERNNGNH